MQNLGRSKRIHFVQIEISVEGFAWNGTLVLQDVGSGIIGPDTRGLEGDPVPRMDLNVNIMATLKDSDQPQV